MEQKIGSRIMEQKIGPSFMEQIQDKRNLVEHKGSYDTRNKIRIKPTLYFTEKEIKKLDELTRKNRSIFIKSFATIIEEIVREKLTISNKRKK